MIAAEAPTKEQNDSALRTLALEDLMRENDALSAAFDVEAFDILPTDTRRLDFGWTDRGANHEFNVLSAPLPRETTAKLVNPTSAPGCMGPAAPTRTERKQHQERLHGSKRAQLAPRASSMTPTSRSLLASV